MEKAYDLASLVGFIKAEGLEVAEDGAEAIYTGFKKWIQASAVMSVNKIDDMVAPFLSQLDGIVLPVIDKINPEDNA